MLEEVNRLLKEEMRDDLPNFNPGDTVRVGFKIVEGKKTRHQSFEGIVIRKRGSGPSKTFTLRRISYGVGVERTFPLHSPNIEEIKIVSRGRARRSRLYYTREMSGKAVRMRQRRR
jgi:large subunit ribosomal protein L19